MTWTDEVIGRRTARRVGHGLARARGAKVLMVYGRARRQPGDPAEGGYVEQDWPQLSDVIETSR
jgi:hypothetical protein